VYFHLRPNLGMPTPKPSFMYILSNSGKQFEQSGTHANRYDVTILVNGLPLVQIELKKRGIAIREAFNQVHRYSKESFNSENSLYKYLQIFVISNGTSPNPLNHFYSRYLILIQFYISF
jgi:hypothetical protein